MVPSMLAGFTSPMQCTSPMHERHFVNKCPAVHGKTKALIMRIRSTQRNDSRYEGKMFVSSDSQVRDSQMFPTYNDERLKHAELYKNYTEDY
uniref:Uncharacterized protein n=1 Tax=Romanomermis culicivorax TaxID=13658 RepID=A0A915JZT3_ROMCU